MWRRNNAIGRTWYYDAGKFVTISRYIVLCRVRCPNRSRNLKVHLNYSRDGMGWNDPGLGGQQQP